MIANLQDAGKTPDDKHRFTIRRIILIIEDKLDINNLVGKGSDTPSSLNQCMNNTRENIIIINNNIYLNPISNVYKDTSSVDL